MGGPAHVIAKFLNGWLPIEGMVTHTENKSGGKPARYGKLRKLIRINFIHSGFAFFHQFKGNALA